MRRECPRSIKPSHDRIGIQPQYACVVMRVQLAFLLNHARQKRPQQPQVDQIMRQKIEIIYWLSLLCISPKHDDLTLDFSNPDAIL